MKKVYTLCAVGVLLAGSLAMADQEKVAPIKMNKPVDFPHAGIRLAMPTGFDRQPLGEEFAVMVAKRIEGMRATQSISLMAFPVSSDQTAEAFSQSLLSNLKGDLAVRHLKVLNKTKMRIAGLDGLAQSIAYTHRGIETVAVGVCFIRQVKKTPVAGESADAKKADSFAIAYLLSMEVAATHKNILFRTFDEIVKTIALTDFRKPIDVIKQFKGPFLKDHRSGCGVRVPPGWVGVVGKTGLSVFQADYLAGGVPSPIIQVVSLEVPNTAAPEACGKKAIEFERKQGFTIDILSQGPVTVGKNSFYQFVLRKSVYREAESPAATPATPGQKPPGKTAPATAPTKETKPAATTAPPAETTPKAKQPAAAQPVKKKELVASVIEVRRLLNLPSENVGKSWHYAIIMTCQDCDEKQAVAFMDKFTKGFITFKPAEPKEK
ncbi:MAG: hypothetical protein K8S55_05005 [Phycisphaerae bacterium]|nr:hypothetical protein [Phycisphaerae bacterium]